LRNNTQTAVLVVGLYITTFSHVVTAKLARAAEEELLAKAKAAEEEIAAQTKPTEEEISEKLAIIPAPQNDKEENGKAIEVVSELFKSTR